MTQSTFRITRTSRKLIFLVIQIAYKLDGTDINSFQRERIRMDNSAMILVSIIGDSISTFEHYNPPDYAVFYDKEKQALNGMTSVYDTWWAKVNQALHANLCVNN